MKNEIYYLDDNNNVVSKENATHAIIREVDENGKLIKESFMVKNNDKEIKCDEEIKKQVEEIFKNLNEEKGKSL